MATADIFTKNYAYLYYVAIGIGTPRCNQAGNYYDRVVCGSNSMKGDVNQDNLIKYEDACTIVRNIGGTPSCCLDLDNDRSITSTDALRAMLIAFEAIQRNMDGGTNPERCSGCGPSNCGTCSTRETCITTTCGWNPTT